MSIGSIPGDLVASIVLDTVTLAAESGSIGVSVASIAADGPSAVRVTLSAPADLTGITCIAEVDSNGGAPFVAVCEPTGSPSEWRISWAPVGGGGGITSITATAPVVATVAGAAAFVSLAAGSAPGDVLAWNGAAWVPVPLPSSSWTVNLGLGGSHNNASPLTIGGVFFDAPRTLAVACQAQFVGSAPFRAALSLVDSTGAVAAQWDTQTAGFAANRVNVGLPAPVALPAGWYTITLAQNIGAGSTIAAGLYLTE